MAFNYGRTTEEWIGEWLKARTEAGSLDRSKFYISTKCNMAGAGGTAPAGGEQGPHGYESDVLETSCRASIARLQCDYIDLYQREERQTRLPLLPIGGGEATPFVRSPSHSSRCSVLASPHTHRHLHTRPSLVLHPPQFTGRVETLQSSGAAASTQRASIGRWRSPTAARRPPSTTRSSRSRRSSTRS